MPVFDHGTRGRGEDGATTDHVTDRVLTIPNLISLVRLAALPFVYLDIVNGNEGRALLVLVAVSWSDWIDGYVARRFDQVSRIGKLADPITDRLLVVVVGVAFIVADIVTWWAIVALFVRDVVVIAGGVVLLTRSVSPPEVTELGKAATFGLMSALPMFLLAAYYESATLRGGAWLLLGSFGVLYYVSAVQYIAVARRELHATR